MKSKLKCYFISNKAETYYRAGHFGQLNPELALGIEAAGEVIFDPLWHSIVKGIKALL